MRSIVFFDIGKLGISAQKFDQLTQENGLRFSYLGGTRIRAVTHLDVSREDIETAIRIITQLTNQI